MQKEEKPKEAKKAKVNSNYKPFVVLFNKNKLIFVFFQFIRNIF